MSCRVVGIAVVVSVAVTAVAFSFSGVGAQPEGIKSGGSDTPNPGGGSTPTTPGLTPPDSGPAAASVPPSPPGPGSGAGCSGFALLTPLFGISNRGVNPANPNHRETLRITGPVQSGLGGGYYWDLIGCKGKDPVWTLGWDIFGFSEGLDPSKTFHVGLGGGFGLTVFGKFQFGIDLGYDLVRLETFESGGVTRSYSNGLLTFNDVLGCGQHLGGASGESGWRCAGRNFTWLLTFGVTTGGGATTGSAGGAGSGSAGSGSAER